MSSYEDSSIGKDALSGVGDPEAIEASIERARTQLTHDVEALAGKTDPRVRARQALSTAKDKTTAAASRARAAAPQKAREAGQAVRGNPKTATGAALLVVLAGAAGTVLATRRRTAKASAARSRWSRFIGR